jgi:hypothetical protein
MLIVGANRLEENKHLVDEMNVFPVPDGDTGTNMSFTVTSALKEVLKAEGNTVGEVAAALSSGALRGARGNSGVIVSQLFRGMARGLKDQTEIDSITLAKALDEGVEKAYKAVMKPKEGTILTVAKEAAEACMQAALEEDDLSVVLQAAIRGGEEALAKTPELLPVLKEAGVEDAGGKGLMFLYHGMYEALTNDSTEDEPLLALTNTAGGTDHVKTNGPAQGAFATESIKFCYCTEFIAEKVKDAESHEESLRQYLSSIGDSLVVVAEGDLIKVHVHTNDPGLVLQKATALGELTSVKIENMRLQHQNILQEANQAGETKQPEVSSKPRKAVGFVAVSTGDGFKEIFESLGVDYIITGGQTMNPSTEDVLKGCEAVNADVIYVLPNNKNIIMAAEQAAKMMEDKKVFVVPSRSVPQGIAALINFMPDTDPQEAAQAMTDSLSSVVTGQVTFAVRDTHMGEFDIKENDILALLDGDICRVGHDRQETTMNLLDAMVEKADEIISIYYGEDATAEEAEALADHVRQVKPAAEVEIYYGGQPLYSYIISAE